MQTQQVITMFHRTTFIQFLLAVPAIYAEDTYTTNFICKQKHCINPLFPGLTDIPTLETLEWACYTASEVSAVAGFCKDVVTYDPSLPVAIGNETLDKLVEQQDEYAMTTYFYHLNGMGYEAWDYTDPGSEDDCFQYLWKFACYTYFPKAPTNCTHSGSRSYYQRPCSFTCQNYKDWCGVECCDEGDYCVFTDEGGYSGYFDASSANSSCTGAARRGLSLPIGILLCLFGVQFSMFQGATSRVAIPASEIRPRTWLSMSNCFIVGLAATFMLLLEGCTLSVPIHHTAYWLDKENYLIEYAYKETAGGEYLLNSCASTTVSTVCSGNGYCSTYSSSSSLTFCVCDSAYADPECSTTRKSQTIAFVISLFGGWLGIDCFYLGFYYVGVLKLVTLGGLGAWWLLDVVRLGSGAVYASDFRVAADLSHKIYVIAIIFLALFVGLVIALTMFARERKQKRKNFAATQAHGDARTLKALNAEMNSNSYGTAQR